MEPATGGSWIWARSVWSIFFLNSQYDILLSALEYLYSLTIDAASLCIYFWQMIADLEQCCCGILFFPVAKLRGRVHLRLSLLVSEPSAMRNMLFVKYTVPRDSGWLSCPVESPALRSVDLLSEEGSFLARLGYQLGVFWYRCYIHIVSKRCWCPNGAWINTFKRTNKKSF